jgi:hypothetical protein
MAVNERAKVDDITQERALVPRGAGLSEFLRHMVLWRRYTDFIEKTNNGKQESTTNTHIPVVNESAQEQLERTTAEDQQPVCEENSLDSFYIQINATRPLIFTYEAQPLELNEESPPSFAEANQGSELYLADMIKMSRLEPFISLVLKHPLRTLGLSLFILRIVAPPMPSSLGKPTMTIDGKFQQTCERKRDEICDPNGKPITWKDSLPKSTPPIQP